MPPFIERRKRPRLNLRCPVSLYTDVNGLSVVRTKTENLSSEGFYCIVAGRFPLHQRLVSVIEIPLESWRHSEQTLRLRCQVSVTRVEELANGAYGIACRIVDYSVVAVDPASASVAAIPGGKPEADPVGSRF
jgi:hypothetical protein